jgi:3-hydroxyisobutyrate dehydrogenase
MSDISICITGKAGRITLTRPQALNAMTYEMCLAIETAFDTWREDEAVKLIVLDAEGERAFCSGGDISDLYAAGRRGDFTFGQKFWADEYRLNHKIFHYPKPVVSFLQGFTMGGGVGIGCHGSHRIVGESSQIAMPECGIGLVPDVGGSLMLALAPGRLGEYLGATATRMDADDAIFSGFADSYIPQLKWPSLTRQLEQTGDVAVLEPAVEPAPTGHLRGLQKQIDTFFAGETLGDILRLLRQNDSDFARSTLKLLSRGSPLSMACAVEMMHRLRGPGLTLEKALDLEYRFTCRAAEHGDFLEGIRAAIIDKDRSPKWQYADQNVPRAAVSRMLRPLGENSLTL